LRKIRIAMVCVKVRVYICEGEQSLIIQPDFDNDIGKHLKVEVFDEDELQSTIYFNKGEALKFTEELERAAKNLKD